MRCAVCEHDAENVCIPDDEEAANKQFANYKRLSDARSAISIEIDDIENGSDGLDAADHYRLGDLYEDLHDVDDQLNELVGPCSADEDEDEDEEYPDIEDDDLDLLFPSPSDGWVDVSHLESLVYRFAGSDGDDVELVVDMPSALWVSLAGDHFIVDTEGVGSIIPGAVGAMEITAYPLAGNGPFPNGPLW